MNERQANVCYDYKLRRPTAKEREAVRSKWGKCIRKESKCNKIRAEIRICAMILVMLVMIMRVPEKPSLLVCTGVLMAVCFVLTFIRLVHASQKLEARQKLLNQGRFWVAATEGKRIITSWDHCRSIGVEVERVSATIGGEYPLLRTQKYQGITGDPRNFHVLLVQLEGETEVVALLQL